jgi:hypothetical protein
MIAQIGAACNKKGGRVGQGGNLTLVGSMIYSSAVEED